MDKKRFSILAVDDDRAILDLYHKVFCASPQAVESSPSSGDDQTANSNHYTVSRPFVLTLCEQAEEAVEAVRMATEKERPFAMALVDVRLPPGPDGVWAAEQIRRVDPNIGIVLVTGYFDTDLGEVERRVPPPDKLLYLQKPFNPKEILQFASSMCAKWEAEHELSRINVHLEAMVAERTSALTEVNRRLRTSEDNFRNIITNNADSIVIFDENQVVKFVNPAAEALFEKRATGLIGEPLGYPLVAGETTELDIVRGTKNPTVAEMRVVVTSWEGETAYLASLRDITEHNLVKEELRQSLNDLQETMRGTIQAMAATVEVRDPYTAGHQQRVANLSRAIAQEMGFPRFQIEGIYLAAIIHDIGKTAIPSEILSNPGQLTDIEYKMIQCHSQVGYDILKGIKFTWPIAQIVLQHHERMDGSGYPQGISGEEILIEARILGVADAVEAMAAHRPYRPGLGIDVALEEISKNRGILYDPEVVDVCLKLFKEKGFEWD